MSSSSPRHLGPPGRRGLRGPRGAAPPARGRPAPGAGRRAVARSLPALPAGPGPPRRPAGGPGTGDARARRRHGAGVRRPVPAGGLARAGRDRLARARRRSRTPWPPRSTCPGGRAGLRGPRTPRHAGTDRLRRPRASPRAPPRRDGGRLVRHRRRRARWPASWPTAAGARTVGIVGSREKVALARTLGYDRGRGPDRVGLDRPAARRLPRQGRRLPAHGRPGHPGRRRGAPRPRRPGLALRPDRPVQRGARPPGSARAR